MGFDGMPVVRFDVDVNGILNGMLNGNLNGYIVENTNRMFDGSAIGGSNANVNG